MHYINFLETPSVVKSINSYCQSRFLLRLCYFSRSFTKQLTNFFLSREFSYKTKNCTKLRTAFSNTATSFFDCAISNSEPVTYCTKCGDNSFAAVEVSYNKLVDNETCKAEFFNQDRLNILEMVFSSAKSLWDAGFCSSNFCILLIKLRISLQHSGM